MTPYFEGIVWICVSTRSVGVRLRDNRSYFSMHSACNCGPPCLYTYEGMAFRELSKSWPCLCVGSGHYRTMGAM